MSDVVNFGGITTVPMSVEKVLTSAIKALPEEALVIGWDAEGKLYFAGTHSEMEWVLMLLKMAERQIMDTMMESYG